MVAPHLQAVNIFQVHVADEEWPAFLRGVCPSIAVIQAELSLLTLHYNMTDTSARDIGDLGIGRRGKNNGLRSRPN